MGAQDFCYWLRGYLELSHEQTLSPRQTEIIKQHLDLVFKEQETVTLRNLSTGESREILIC